VIDMTGDLSRKAAADMTERLVADRERYGVWLEPYPIDGADIAIDDMLKSKLMATMAVGEIDVIMTDKAFFEELANLRAFTPVGEAFDEETLALLAPYFHTLAPVVNNSDGTTTTLPSDAYGLRLDDSVYLQGFGFETSELVIGIVHNAVRPDAAVEALRLILGVE